MIFKRELEKQIVKLERENAELKERYDKVDIIGYDALKNLTKAKELLTKWVELFKPKGGNIPPTPIQVDTEQFLEEIERGDRKMKDEELFKAWKSEQYKDQSTEERMEFVEHLHTFPKYFEKTFLAGLKAGRPQWHDLRKDPTDLPDEGTYLVVWRNDYGYKEIFIMNYEEDDEEELHWVDGDCEVQDEHIIAWCEIPTFDKE